MQIKNLKVSAIPESDMTTWPEMRSSTDLTWIIYTAVGLYIHKPTQIESWTIHKVKTFMGKPCLIVFESGEPDSHYL